MVDICFFGEMSYKTEKNYSVKLALRVWQRSKLPNHSAISQWQWMGTDSWSGESFNSPIVLMVQEERWGKPLSRALP